MFKFKRIKYLDEYVNFYDNTCNKIFLKVNLRSYTFYSFNADSVRGENIGTAIYFNILLGNEIDVVKLTAVRATNVNKHKSIHP